MKALAKLTTFLRTLIEDITMDRRLRNTEQERKSIRDTYYLLKRSIKMCSEAQQVENMKHIIKSQLLDRYDYNLSKEWVGLLNEIMKYQLFNIENRRPV